MVVRKHGGQLADKHLNYMRDCLAATAVCTNTPAQERAKVILVAALLRNKLARDFYSKLSIMLGHIVFIQEKFKNRQVFLEAKLFMLEAYWDLVLEWLVRRGNALKSKTVLEVAARIGDVEPSVRTHVLERLLWQNQKLANIATYRKRQAEKPDVCDIDEVEL